MPPWALGPIPLCLSCGLFAGPGMSYAQAPAEGLWTGVDSHGVPLSFVVTNGGGQVDFLAFEVSCPTTALVQPTSHLTVSASQFSFSQSGPGTNCVSVQSLSGAFDSATTASGTSRSTYGGVCGVPVPFCIDMRSWTASRNAAVVVADLAVTVTDGRQVASPGAATTYVITVTNKGPHAVDILRLRDIPPFLETSPAWSVSRGAYDPASGTWLGAPLTAGSNLTFQVTGHLGLLVGTLATNTASVSAIGAFDPDPHNDTAWDGTLVRTLAIWLSASTVAATPPTTIVLATSLANQGTDAAENVEVAFSLPPGLTFSGNSGDCTTTFPCALGTMPPSSQRTITTSVELPQGYTGPDSLVFSVKATTTTPTATGPDDTAVWTVGVLHPQPALYHVVEPCRLLDTRSTEPILAGATRTVVVTGSCGVPASARALALNVTVVAPTGDGDLRLFPGTPPGGSTASAINFRAGQTRANNAVVALGGAGDLSILAEMASGSVHVILDVGGYFE